MKTTRPHVPANPPCNLLLAALGLVLWIGCGPNLDDLPGELQRIGIDGLRPGDSPAPSSGATTSPIITPDAAPRMREDAAPLPTSREPDCGTPSVAITPDAGVDVAPEPTSQTTGSVPRAGDLRITEVQVNPAGTDSGREWFEIVNLTEHPIALGGIAIADAAREVPLETTEVLAPRAHLVLGQRLEDPVNLAYGSTIAFNNDGDSLSLCLGPCADGIVIDRLQWSALGAAYDGHPLQRDPGNPETTCPAPMADGSPGIENPACAP